jgi:hypothetical protein
MSVRPLKADIRQREWHVRLVPIADINEPVENPPVNTLALAKLVSQHLLQLFDFPSGLVVHDKRLAAADRLVKYHHSVGNCSRYTFIFPRTA